MESTDLIVIHTEAQMNKLTFPETIKYLKLRQPYYLYACLFGLSSLVVPLGAQFLVNNLALSGIWVNVFSFMVLITLGIIISSGLKYYLVVLKEYIQRELFMIEASKWTKKLEIKESKYFLESVMLLKSFSSVFTNFVEISLIFIFGMIAIISFHPVFVTIAIFFGVYFYLVYTKTEKAIHTSIEESNQKYDMFDLVIDNKNISEGCIYKYLVARDDHFTIVKKITLHVSVLTFLCQITLLGSGIYLIGVGQLSIGQLIASEIILSGILQVISKLPETLEALYDFETSIYKLNKALGEVSHV
jgi:ABC-type protease/lipase transport system fused ATPase/permease subunit